MGGGWRKLKKNEETDENSKIWNNKHGTGTDQTILIILKLEKEVTIFEKKFSPYLRYF